MYSNKEESQEFQAMRDMAIEQLKKGESLTGEERIKGNKRNGKGTKTLKTSSGNIEIQTPEDRHSSFSPETVKKRQRVLADNFEQRIISLYGKGIGLRDISDHLSEMYDVDISPAVLSEITDRVLPEIKQWQDRPLDKIYPIIWLDAMYYKVRESGKVVTRCLYNILAINGEGRKELIGMYISENEGANFWLSVLTHLKNRGVEDILIACTDNSQGFSEAILSIFPATQVQKCVVHQIRNSLKYVASKNQKEFAKDLKTVYQSVTKESAETNLSALEDKWGNKYPIVIDSWKRNWEELSTFFQYGPLIRKMIYTTNPDVRFSVKGLKLSFLYSRNEI